jgi:subtilisin family serine protease
MNALHALALLKREMPSERFFLNRLYRPYHPAMDDGAVDESGRQKPQTCVNDRCYGRATIGWTSSLSQCARNAAIGVIDTDFDLTHPAFSRQKIVQRGFIPEGKKLAPNWHGTAVLSLLAGRPDSGTPGLVPEAHFHAASIFFAGDDGEAVTDTVSLVKALDWMKASRVRLVNMSFAGPQDELVELRIKAMRQQGFVFIAAAGNDGPAAPPVFPAAYDGVVAVTAVDRNQRVLLSANRGDYVDLAAPGVRIWTAMPGSREGYRSGTSFAAPFATAVLALEPEEVLSASEDAVLRHVRTVSPGNSARNPIYGRGVLQAPSKCPAKPATAAYEVFSTSITSKP